MRKVKLFSVMNANETTATSNAAKLDGQADGDMQLEDARATTTLRVGT